MQNLVQQLWRSLTETSKLLGQLRRQKSNRVGGLLVGLTLLIGPGSQYGASAQAVDPTVVDPDLVVKTVVAGLNQPTNMAFLPSSHTPMTDILVLEKRTGRVQMC
jgi:hypothetical protein